MIWFCLVVPFIFAFFTWFLFSHRILWWEIVIPIIANLLLVLIAYELAVYSVVGDTEYWTGWVTKSEYYEPWTEEYTETEEYTDSKGKTHTRTVTKHRYHAADYYIKDSTGGEYYSNSTQYHSLVRKFGNEKFEDIWRMNQVSIGDGNKYYTVYPNDRAKMVVCTSAHSYTNKIQGSKAVFHFEKPADTTGLYDYPPVDHMHTPSILGVPIGDPANIELCKRNAELGGRKQVRMWILLFHEQPVDAALRQEQYWTGGNKNEIVACIGVVDGKPKWAYVFAWGDNEQLKVDIRDFITEQPELNLKQVVKYMSNEVESRWNRKSFSDFKYIAVEPPFYAVITTFILSVLLNVGFFVYAVMNDESPEKA